MDGELDRVGDGLEELLGVLNLRTETGSLDERGDDVELRLRAILDDGDEPASSLCERERGYGWEGLAASSSPGWFGELRWEGGDGADDSGPGL